MCGVLRVVWVHKGVVLCDELCVVLFGVLRGGGVVWCVVCGCMRVLCCVMSCVLCCLVCCVVVVLCGVWCVGV